METKTPKKKTPKKKIPRHAMPEQPPEDRARNFDEVPYGYTEELAIAEASRCIQCKKPKCIGGCPVNVNIPAFLGLIRDGQFAEAAQRLKHDARELDRAIAACVAHYHNERSHQGIGNEIVSGTMPQRIGQIEKSQVLGGLHHR